jgi:prevent-host-death family protein
MLTVNIHEAKTHLSRLLDRAARGEPFIIAKAGKPLVKVVPLDAPRSPVRFAGSASWKGRLWCLMISIGWVTSRSNSFSATPPEAPVGHTIAGAGR